MTGDGTMRLDLNNAGDPITDNFGNTLVAAHTGDQTYTIEHTPPSATAMTVPANGTYTAGQNLDFTVTFSEAVAVTGTPRIAVTLTTGGTVYANYLSGSGTNTLTFQYTVVPGQQDLTGIVTGTSIDANGGTIQDAATNNAVLAVNAVEPSTAGIDIDAIVPAVSERDRSDQRRLTASHRISIFQSTSPRSWLSTRVGARPPSRSRSTRAAPSMRPILAVRAPARWCSATLVPSGERDTNGIALAALWCSTAARSRTPLGNNAALALTDVGSTSGVLVDSIPPTVCSIDTVASGTEQPAAPKLSRSRSPRMSASILPMPLTSRCTQRDRSAERSHSVTAVSGSVYTVTVTGVTGDGTMRLDLNTGGSTITDAYGNPLVAAYNSGQSYTIEHTPPSATAMTVPANATYGAGQNLDFTVTFDEAVTVTGTPRIAVTLDTGGTVYAELPLR